MFQYLSGVIREFSYIRWLSLRRVASLTVLVIAVGLISGFLLGATDSLFASVLRNIVT